MSDPTAHGTLRPGASIDLDTPRVALAVGAHPDDVEFGCGGTLAKWASRGCRIHHLVCTDGSKGTWDPSQDRGELVRLRMQEQRRASEALGGEGRVEFMGRVDGELHADSDACSFVAREIRRVRPDVVLGHDPWRRYRLHPDHRNAGFLVTDGLVAARDPHFFPEHGLAPHRPAALLLWEADEPDHVEDIAAFEDPKLTALLAHTSQFRSTMKIDDSEAGEQVSEFAERVRRRHATDGSAYGIAAAEIFKLLTDL